MLTQEHLCATYHYCPNTGILTHRRLNRAIGWENACGHLVGKINRSSQLVHRAIWVYMTGTLPIEHIDHANGNPSDNRWINLREATNGENRANSKTNKNNKSGFKGVSAIGSRWKASVRINNKRIYLGCFSTPEEAHAAYCEAAIKHHGSFQNSGA